MIIVIIMIIIIMINMIIIIIMIIMIINNKGSSNDDTGGNQLFYRKSNTLCHQLRMFLQCLSFLSLELLIMWLMVVTIGRLQLLSGFEKVSLYFLFVTVLYFSKLQLFRHWSSYKTTISDSVTCHFFNTRIWCLSPPWKADFFVNLFRQYKQSMMTIIYRRTDSVF